MPQLNVFSSLAFRFALLLWLICHELALPAQPPACKPLLRANRHKELIMSDPELNAHAFESGGRRYTSESAGKGLYRITVSQSGRILAQFTSTGGDMADQVYREYDASGLLLFTDSLDHTKGKHLKSYLEFYSSGHVVSSTNHYPNGRASRRIDYSLRTGADSLIREWYSSGLPKSLHLRYSRPQEDSVVMAWDDSGILREHQNGNITLLYFPNGILQQKKDLGQPYRRWDFSENGILEVMARDTVISLGLCREQQSFYPSGVLRSVEYYNADTPCLTWRYYSPEGILTKQVKKGPVRPVGIGVIEPVALLAPEIFAYVEQLPEYPGGMAAYRKEMEKRLAYLLCNSEVKLEGTYTLDFRIDEYGIPALTALQGANADQLRSAFTTLYSTLPKWGPGKQNGRALTMYFTAEVRVQKKP